MLKITAISELERLLAEQKGRLQQLQSKRKRLTAQIDRIDKQIESLLGKPAAPQKVRRRKRGPRGLEQRVLAVLGKTAEPRTAAEIAKAVAQAGYKSESKDFPSLVRQICYRSRLIQTKERGKFALASPTSPPKPVVKTKKVVKKKKTAAK